MRYQDANNTQVYIKGTKKCNTYNTFLDIKKKS